MTPLEKVINALGGFGAVKKTANGYQACCPAHDDRSPSLSIKEEEPGGKVLLNCFADCDVESVVKALGLEMKDLFAEDKPNLSVVASSPMKLVDTYHYTDMNHKPLYEVRRYEPKTFRPYLPGASRAGLNGTERVLYHLPALVDALVADDDVMIVEGERDVHSLEAAGYVATTNSGGSAGWLDSFGDIFQGTEGLVVVVADNDPAGAKWAGQVAASLASRDVDHEVYQVPGAHGADITDHLAAGREIDELKDVEAGERVTPAESDSLFESDNPFERALIDWSTFYEAERVEHDWLCEPILARGRGHVLFAEAKGGKSFFVLPMACHLASGEAWLDMPAHEPVHVLYVDWEMTEDDLWERIQQFGFFKDGKHVGYLHYCLLPSSEGLDTQRGGQELLELALKLGCELVIIDTMSRAVEGDENDADTIRNYYKHTGSLLKAHKITTLRLDHAGKDKSKGSRGSSAKNDDVDVVAMVRRVGTEAIEIGVTHSRVGWIPTLTKIEVKEDRQGIMRHTIDRSISIGFGAGAGEDARLLASLGVTAEMSRRTVRGIVNDNEVTMSDIRISDAIRYLKTRSDDE